MNIRHFLPLELICHGIPGGPRSNPNITLNLTPSTFLAGGSLVISHCLPICTPAIASEQVKLSVTATISVDTAVGTSPAVIVEVGITPSINILSATTSIVDLEGSTGKVGKEDEAEEEEEEGAWVESSSNSSKRRSNTASAPPCSLNTRKDPVQFEIAVSKI
jgi:hypothetical protein